MYLAMRVKNEAPEPATHRCNDFCSSGCGFCGDRICLDSTDFVSKRIGDTMEFVSICLNCDKSEAA